MASKKRTHEKPKVTRLPERRGRDRVVRPGVPTLTVNLVSIEIKHNGWPVEIPQESDLSLIVQVESPGAPAESRVLASERLTFRASVGRTVRAADLPSDERGAPFFRGPVPVSDHVNLHLRYFIERTNVLGPIVGAALNTVVGESSRRIPLLPEPLREALHVQIGKTIATEIGRATVIVPVEPSMAGTHPLSVALVSPRTISRVQAPPGSPAPFQQGVVTTEGELAALLTLTLDLKL